MCLVMVRWVERPLRPLSTELVVEIGRPSQSATRYKGLSPQITIQSKPNQEVSIMIQPNIPQPQCRLADGGAIVAMTRLTACSGLRPLDG